MNDYLKKKQEEMEKEKFFEQNRNRDKIEKHLHRFFRLKPTINVKKIFVEFFQRFSEKIGEKKLALKNEEGVYLKKRKVALRNQR